MAVTMTLTLTLDGVTYGELYEFVDAARAAGVPADEAVRCLGSDDKGDRFELEIGPGRRRPGAGGAAAGEEAQGQRVGRQHQLRLTCRISRRLRATWRSVSSFLRPS